MQPTNQYVSMSVDAAGFIVTDSPCLQCGYNLRGISHLSNCPECNSPASLALQGDMLRFADPDWLDSLAKGCRLYLWGILVAICVGMTVGLASTFVGVPQLGHVGGFLAGLVSVYGVWLITHPDPGGVSEERNGKARKWVRFAIIFSLCQGFLNLILMNFKVPLVAAFVLVPVAIAAFVFQTTGEVAKFYYLKGLAERLPNFAYANRAKLIARAYLIIMPLIALAAIVITIAMFTNLIPGGGPSAFGLPVGFPFAPGSLTPPVAPVATPVAVTGPKGAALVMLVTGGCFIAPAVLALFVFLILGFILIYNLGQSFREQSYYARAYREILKSSSAPIEPPPSAGADA